MITYNELEEVLRSGEKVIYHEHRSHTDIEYTVIAATIRYNKGTKDFDIWLKLKDLNANSTMVTPSKFVRRK